MLFVVVNAMQKTPLKMDMKSYYLDFGFVKLGLKVF